MNTIAKIALSTSMIMTATQSFASMEKPVDLSKFSLKNTASDEMKAEIQKAMSKKDVKLSFSAVIPLLSRSFTSAENDQLMSDKYQVALNNNYGSIAPQAHNPVSTAGGVGTGDSTGGGGAWSGSQESLTATCYANCHSNCHSACHGSRGWR